MSTGAAAGGAAAAAAAIALMNSVSAAGGMVRVEPEDFLRLLDRHEAPIMIHYLGGWSLFTATAHHSDRSSLHHALQRADRRDEVD